MSETRSEGFVPGSHPIEAYGAGGFRFAGMSHRGSILALPSGIRAWSAAVPYDIDPSALADVFAEPRGAVELLLLGTGHSLVIPGVTLRDQLAKAGISVDAMSTGAAIRTYNVLLDERRRVAAALLAVD